jgi:hypothetical protein
MIGSQHRHKGLARADDTADVHVEQPFQIVDRHIPHRASGRDTGCRRPMGTNIKPTLEYAGK